MKTNNIKKMAGHRCDVEVLDRLERHCVAAGLVRAKYVECAIVEKLDRDERKNDPRSTHGT